VIVLDEQLLGRKIDEAIAKWYQGPVLFVTELRLGTIIKDDVIPQLLRLQQNPLNPKRVECSSFLTNSMGASDDVAE